MMTNGKIGAAVVGGYLLGRTKKAKLAIGLGMFLAGKKLSLNPQQIGKLVKDNPALSALSDQVRGELVDATKSAAGSALTQRMTRLSDSLQDRTEALNSPGTQGRREDDDEDERDAPADEAPEDASADDEAPEDASAEDEAPEDASADDEAPEDEKAPAKAPAKSTRSTGARAEKSAGAQRSTPSNRRPRPSPSSNGSKGGGKGTSKSAASRSGSTAKKTERPARKQQAKTKQGGGDDRG